MPRGFPPSPTHEPFVAVSLLTASELELLGGRLQRVYRLEETDMFDDLLAAIDRADTGTRTGSTNGS